MCIRDRTCSVDLRDLCEQRVILGIKRLHLFDQFGRNVDHALFDLADLFGLQRRLDAQPVADHTKMAGKLVVGNDIVHDRRAMLVGKEMALQPWCPALHRAVPVIQRPERGKAHSGRQRAFHLVAATIAIPGLDPRLSLIHI